ncbi:kinesin-like protein KIN-7D, mitochondrial [Spinacia oleracea]|uniref:Kinesin-like protein KIN-7D, mitochondrial n=1 Tax=Spinacia oleracea TaxID=3562 RepID=A0A9R0JWS3_SPIOL|nr:kinesin-like protein KIN-7D, mitochondrial [Spinacia oleracea]XP_056683163.1 kinesin-like protein KIN-7D, mitochondrial [Spinacia oleracea]
MSSRARSSSPYSNHRRTPSPFSSSSSTSSFMNTSGRFIPRSNSTSSSSFPGSTGNNNSTYGSRSMTPNRTYGGHSPVAFSPSDDLLSEPSDPPRSTGDSISVTVRFRPMSDREYQRGDEVSWYPDGDKTVRSEYSPATCAYAFDKVFGPNATTEEVYDIAARPVVKSSMDGVNGTVFAYGVTSSGKTHTMHGDQSCPGIIPLAIKDVFSIIQETPGREFLLRVSYLEIYNEVINDLLDPTGQNLRVREDAQGTYVEGIKEEVVLSPGHALSFIAAGEEHRHVGSNNFNLFSSRSHTIFSLMIESGSHGDEYDGVIFSQLNLIDLAGSESSKTETTGLRRKEGSYINKSLLTLGTVIGKLSEGKASHIPYRDSKLTRLLQSSLSGRGHVSLICTVTPASSSMEETHNTLKFASRAKRVEIFASRNKIIDEKSLIKKYQREITTLKEELDQLRRGMLVGVSHEEILTLKQKLEEGQYKMQSRLEEEEEAKAALMSRIQRLTKLILVSSKNNIPSYLGDVAAYQRSHSDDKLELGDSENNKDSSSALSDPSVDFKHKRSSSKWNDELSAAGSILMESNQDGEFISGSNLTTDDITASDEMDLLVEQVKMLAGEIAFSTSTLKRLVEQSANDPDAAQSQIHNLECEIQDKRKQMRLLEQRIIQSGEASVASASLLDMQQTVTRLKTECSQKEFELELKTADNRILQEQLQNKCAENIELLERLNALEKHVTSVNGDSSLPSVLDTTDEYTEELKKKVQSQEMENEKLKLEHVQLLEENSGLCVQNQKLSEEASYAKELASAAAVELKNLAAEVTKISVQNAKLEKELLASREYSHTRGSQISNGGNRKHGDGMKGGRKGRYSSRGNDVSGGFYDDSYSLDLEDLKMELLARKQREAALEAALADKEFVEEECRTKVEEAKRREVALENDLANMWVLVAKLKKEVGAVSESRSEERLDNGDILKEQKATDVDNNGFSKETQPLEVNKAAQDAPSGEPLVARLKARMQEMKDKEKSTSNGETNSHLCKVCYESPTAAILLPCRHFCLCKPCSLACSECPICRTNIADRIFAFTS